MQLWNNWITANKALQKRWSPEAYGENSGGKSHKLQQGNSSWIEGGVEQEQVQQVAQIDCVIPILRDHTAWPSKALTEQPGLSLKSALPWGGDWSRRPPEVPSSPSQCMILWNGATSKTFNKSISYKASLHKLLVQKQILLSRSPVVTSQF